MRIEFSDFAFPLVLLFYIYIYIVGFAVLMSMGILAVMNVVLIVVLCVVLCCRRRHHTRLCSTQPHIELSSRALGVTAAELEEVPL